jgi:hypothetical protein
LTDGSGERRFATSMVRALVGDGVIYEQHNEINKSVFAKKQAENLVTKQDAAARMVLGHFGYNVQKKRASNIFTGLLRKVR